MAEDSLVEKALETLPIPGQPPRASPEGSSKKAPAKQVAKADADVLAEQKAQFSALLEKQKADAPKKAKKAPQSERVIEEDSDEPPAGAEAHAPVKAEEPEKPQELSGARQRLALAGIPRKIIDNLSDPEVDEAWKKQEERESAKDAAIQRAAEYEKQLGIKATGKPSEPQAGVPTEELDLDELANDLSAQFGEDESKAIASVLAKVIGPLQQENAQIKAVLMAAREKGIQDISARNRARLAEKLSFLSKNDSAWQTLHSLAVQASERTPTKYASPEAAFDEAFENVYGDVVKSLAEKAPDKSAGEQKSRVAASTATAPSASKREKTYDVIDASHAAFRALIKGGTVDEAKAAYKHMNVQ